MTTDDQRPRSFFTAAEVATIWTQERQREENDNARADGRPPTTVRPVSRRTVYTFMHRSQPAKPGEKKRGYETNPMPMPVHLDPRRPIWMPEPQETIADLERRLRMWWTTRDGRGSGGGRPRRNRTS